MEPLHERVHLGTERSLEIEILDERDLGQGAALDSLVGPQVQLRARVRVGQGRRREDRLVGVRVETGHDELNRLVQPARSS